MNNRQAFNAIQKTKIPAHMLAYIFNRYASAGVDFSGCSKSDMLKDLANDSLSFGSAKGKVVDFTNLVTAVKNAEIVHNRALAYQREQWERFKKAPLESLK